MKIVKISVMLGATVPTVDFANIKANVALEAEIDDDDEDVDAVRQALTEDATAMLVDHLADAREEVAPLTEDLDRGIAAYFRRHRGRRR